MPNKESAAHRKGLSLIALDVLSDPVCPWCYIGKRLLDTALEESPDLDVTVTWRAFQLNPSMPASGMDRRTYLCKKFGGADAAERAYGHIEASARQAGLDIRFDAIKRTPNTLDAHRLIRFAGRRERQGAMVDRLFRAYFLEGLDISDPRTLVKLSADSGLDADECERFLAGSEARNEVLSEDIRARRSGVAGVPCYFSSGALVANGARPTEFWIATLRSMSGTRTGKPFERRESGNSAPGN